jgi:hypothetical protein
MLVVHIYLFSHSLTHSLTHLRTPVLYDEQNEMISMDDAMIEILILVMFPALFVTMYLLVSCGMEPHMMKSMILSYERIGKISMSLFLTSFSSTMISGQYCLMI